MNERPQIQLHVSQIYLRARWQGDTKSHFDTQEQKK